MNTPSGKPDFSNVQGSVTSTEQTSAKPDFSNVQSTVTSTEEIVGGSAQTYTVVKGDTLSHIAKHFYGKPNWKPIFEANRDQLQDPDKIFPGQVLKIPANDG